MKGSDDPRYEPDVRVRRFPKRGRYDRAAVLEVLDAGVMCHVAFDAEGMPAIIPMLYWHDEDAVYFHASRKSRIARLVENRPVCVSVTHLDGLVLARSAFEHSANYRSVAIHGIARAVPDGEPTARALEAMMERILPGRWDQLRPVTEKEVAATRVISVPLEHASVKTRSGPSSGEPEADLEWPVWGGVLDFRTEMARAVADDDCVAGVPGPEFAVRMEP